ncbi:MAG TPA: MBL fold metallo-hydrolase [Alphaproteobacteria bacterium]|nr:MBL fold metallo-hydrolase [Alphaproteobacteria bacterium]
MRERHPENAPGDWYIDTACMDCSAARTVAPGLIVARGGQSVFARQPSTPAELMMAQRARLLCPTASVRSGSEAPPPADAFPEAMTAGVYRLGYNAKGSYGAHSFLIRRDAGNVMVDSPRWTRAVVARLEAWGGLGDILLSHEDDVGDAGRYAEHFGARVWIHAADRAAAPFADKIIEGGEPVRLDGDLLAIPLPGHTKGSVAYLHDGRHLFTGDSLAWSFEQDDLTAFRSYCWSWTAQRRSLRRLLDYAFEWVFAGHGGSRHLPPAEMRRRLAALIERMAAS